MFECPPGEHGFYRDPVTNEPVGRCYGCSSTVEWVEQQEEQQTPQAFADLPEGDREAYLAALDTESLSQVGNGPWSLQCRGDLARRIRQ